MEVYEQHGDLEQMRGLLGHTRIETTQLSNCQELWIE
jgi:hypothetical protein